MGLRFLDGEQPIDIYEVIRQRFERGAGIVTSNRALEEWYPLFLDDLIASADSAIVAEHPRGTQELLMIDTSHYEGEATEDVLPPLPPGHMGRRLQEIALMPPEQRPLDTYVALMEAAR